MFSFLLSSSHCFRLLCLPISVTLIVNGTVYLIHGGRFYLFSCLCLKISHLVLYPWVVSRHGQQNKDNLFGLAWATNTELGYIWKSIATKFWIGALKDATCETGNLLTLNIQEGSNCYLPLVFIWGNKRKVSSPNMFLNKLKKM